MTTLSTMANNGPLVCTHNSLGHLLVIRRYYNNQMLLRVIEGTNWSDGVIVSDHNQDMALYK